MAQPPAQRSEADPLSAIPKTVFVVNPSGPGCFVRGLYFIFVGWWLAAIWIAIAWLLNVTIVGLPLGLTMLNRVPQIMTLSPGSQSINVIQDADGVLRIARGDTQFPLIVRIIYFILVGWWLSLIWTIVAYFMAIFPFTWPIGYGMFNIIGFVTTLRKN